MKVSSPFTSTSRLQQQASITQNKINKKEKKKKTKTQIKGVYNWLSGRD